MTATSINRPTGGVKLTDEQTHAVDLARKGDDVNIQAYAGTGKTATLVAIATALPGTVSYIAFNKAISHEASRKFPNKVDCRTAHSNAFRGMMAKGFDFERLSQIFSARHHLKNGSPVDKAIVDATLRAFFYSADPELTPDHLPSRGTADHLNAAKELWDEMSRPGSKIPLGHDAYFKLWALSEPKIRAGTILLDESQDSNPALLGVLRRQKAQIILAGDRHQQIYAWRGAEDASAYFPDFQRARLTKSFRFGEAIADQADRVLEALGEETPLRGNPDVISHVMDAGSADAVLCRTNSGVIAEVAALGGAHVLGGKQELARLVQDVQRVQSGQGGVTADLLGFRDWREVQDFAMTDEGAHLRGLCGMVSKHGVNGLYDALHLISERPRDDLPTVSTAHKAKGQEWPAVRIGQDFMPRTEDDGEPPELSDEERRLFYVGITRARKTLVIDPQILELFQS